MESQFTDTELRLGIERSDRYKGTAKIDFSDIRFNSNLSRPLEQQNIVRLREIFLQEGCRRFEIQNHVTAVVSQRHLRMALEAAGATDTDLFTSDPNQMPHLQFSESQVNCLHGQHRIQAAAEILPPDDRWWTVDLYLEDISLELRSALIDEYSNERQPSDGEIYRKIRQYQQEHNAPFQKRWWARLTEEKARRLRQLSDNAELCSSFDAILGIPGLWSGMSLGNLGKLMALNCDEEIVHYLSSHLKKFWVLLVSPNLSNPDVEAMMKIDVHTVRTLELMAPGASHLDARKVQGWLASGEILREFSVAERNRMWEWLRCYDGIIPSLRTFFKDIDYLKSCGDALKRLIRPSKSHPTMQKAFKYHRAPALSAGEGFAIQTSESTFDMRSMSHGTYRELAYRQIWLYAMRHYPKMPRDPTKPNRLAKASNEKADEAVIYDMVVLAYKLGFRSTNITTLMGRSPDALIAQDALLTARKPDLYEYNADEYLGLVQRIVECFSKARLRENSWTPRPLVKSAADLKARCGLPSNEVQESDRRLLFLDHLHTAEAPVTETISTFYVRRCVYFAFFGRLPAHLFTCPATVHSSEGSRHLRPSMSPLFLPQADRFETADPNSESRTNLVDPENTEMEVRRDYGDQDERTGRLVHILHEVGDAEPSHPRWRATEIAGTTISEGPGLVSEETATVVVEECLSIAAEETAVAANVQETRDIRNERDSEIAEPRQVYLERQEDAFEAVHTISSPQRNENSLQGISTAPTEMETAVQHDISIHSAPLQGAGAASRPITEIDIENSLPNFIARLRESNSPPEPDQPALPGVEAKPRAQHVRVEKPSLKPRQTQRDLNRAGGRDAAIADQLGWNLEVSDAVEEDVIASPTQLIAESHVESHEVGPVTEIMSERQVAGIFQTSERDPTQTNSVEQELQIASAIRAAEDALTRQKAKQRVENARRAPEETVDDFTQTRTAEDLFDGGEEATSSAVDNRPAAVNHKRKIVIPDPSLPSQQHDDIPSYPGAPIGVMFDNQTPATVESTSANISKNRRRPPSTITFRTWKGGRWIGLETVEINPTDPFHVERVASRYEVTEHATLYSRNFRRTRVGQCFRTARLDGSYSIFMLFGDKQAITKAMKVAANKI
ncbi:conserved hypothetical protein [Talaromyces stipitatus ATCC 10500]|uniref:Uncharacterized protein n=1 Tax=Talaromyces stipitatus (strain ATCC 10500 / CBS 375.48 / QM 6759 / NRRL 1006) TaxID=441959 RepID=B8M001_TALSN|nr:uncharacterized protein TSTA_081660 [Talaromyces stipitatus ATCC 10500]EED20933.1 conserved hypothetical protein [Talaromyces stipitatus ATCC 10500]